MKTEATLNNIKHIAINGPNLAMSSVFIQNLLKGNNPEFFPNLTGKKGVLFSNTTLEKFINEEFLHENFQLTQESNRSIRTLSSGEQKKALLKYLLKKEPDFLIVDNPFDALDINSVEELKQKLIKLSLTIPVIQVFKRRNDLLPFITHAIRIEQNNVVFTSGINEFLNKYFSEKVFSFEGTIPEPIEHYKVDFNEIIRFEDVNVAYNNKPIIKGINWYIKPGEFWQLKGPNGSGKTTMLTMINGDNPKAFGQNITIFGRKKGSGESVWQIKELIGYFTPSMMELFKYRNNAEQMVISGLVDSIGLYKKPTNLQASLAEKWLKLLGIYELRKKPFNQLSQINQRMVLIARAMIKHPPLLILDEPSTGLDDYSSAVLSSLINKMAAESSTAILYVSHRTEPDLNPQFIYELKPSPIGSVGEIKENTN